MPDSEFFYKLLAGFLALVSSAVGNPTPEEIMLIGAGVSSGLMAKQYGLWSLLMLPSVLAGAVVTDVALYGIGRFLGKRAHKWRWMSRLSPPEKREKIRQNFHRYGFWIFAFGRLVPGIRTTLFLSAGMMKLDLKRFLLADSFGALVGGSLFFFLGYGLGSQFEAQFKAWEDQIAPYKSALILGALAVVAAYLLYKFLRNPVPTGDPTEVPLIGPRIAAALPPPPELPKPPADEADAPPASSRAG